MAGRDRRSPGQEVGIASLVHEVMVDFVRAYVLSNRGRDWTGVQRPVLRAWALTLRGFVEAAQAGGVLNANYDLTAEMYLRCFGGHFVFNRLHGIPNNATGWLWNICHQDWVALEPEILADRWVVFDEIMVNNLLDFPTPQVCTPVYAPPDPNADPNAPRPIRWWTRQVQQPRSAALWALHDPLATV